MNIDIIGIRINPTFEMINFKEFRPKFDTFEIQEYDEIIQNDYENNYAFIDAIMIQTNDL
jgi:hypothetical protein